MVLRSTKSLYITFTVIVTLLEEIFSPALTIDGASEKETITDSRIASALVRSATWSELSSINLLIISSVSSSLKPGTPAPLLSSAIGIEMLLRCSGTDAPVN